MTMETFPAIAFLVLWLLGSAILCPSRYNLQHGVFAVFASLSLWLSSCLFMFFGPVMLLGYVELITGWRAIDLRMLALLQVICVGVAFLSRRKARLFAMSTDRLTVSSHMKAATRWVTRLTILAVVMIACLIMIGFPRGFEVAAYHLPIGMHHFQTGSILTWDHAYMHAFPANASFYYGILLLALPERLVSGANLPFLALACFVVYALARTAGSDKDGATIASLGLITIPTIIFSALELGSDIAGIALVGLALLLLLSRPAPSLTVIFYAGTVAGLAYGFKTLHLIPAALLGLLALVLAFRQHERPVFGGLTGALSYSAGFLMFAGMWLARNWVELGNPTYPVSIGFLSDVLGFTVAPDFDLNIRAATQTEWVSTSAGWLIYPWVEGHFIDQNYKHSSGLGAFFATFVLTAYVATAIRLIKEGIHDRPAAVRLILLIGASVILGVWWVVGDRQPRYVMAAILFTTPLVGAMITNTGGRWRAWLSLFASVTIVVMIGIITSKELVRAASHFVISKQFTRHEFYEYPQEIDSLEPGSVILNLGPRSANYSLYGAHLSNRIVGETAIKPSGVELTHLLPSVARLQSLSVTHIYSHKPLRLPDDSCAVLQKIAADERNPLNGVKLLQPRILYSIQYCESVKATTILSSAK